MFPDTKGETPSWYKPYPITHPEDHLPQRTESFMPDKEKNEMMSHDDCLKRIKKDYNRVMLFVKVNGIVTIIICIVVVILINQL